MYQCMTLLFTDFSLVTSNVRVLAGGGYGHRGAWAQLELTGALYCKGNN